MQVSRRRFLSVPLLGCLALATRSVAAKAPLAGGSLVGVHRLKLGEFEVTTLLDGFIDLPATVLQGDQALVRQHLEAAGLWGSPIRTAVNAFLVNTGERLVLIDCGGAQMLGPTAGRLPRALAQIGVDPGQVDEVYVTHMHGDHLHGAVTPDGARLFPNAVLRIAKADVDYWGSAEIEAKAPENQKGRFVAAKRAIAAYGDRLQPFEPGAELTPGIRSVAASGHTPGHTCFLVTSGKARLLLVGDLLHVAPVQFPRPEITVAFDWNQDLARTRRRELFDLMSNESILIGAAHLPFPGIGRLRARDGGAFAYEPLPWQMF